MNTLEFAIFYLCSRSGQVFAGWVSSSEFEAVTVASVVQGTPVVLRFIPVRVNQSFVFFGSQLFIVVCIGQQLN